MSYIFKLQILRAFYIILSFFIWTIFEIFTSKRVENPSKSTYWPHWLRACRTCPPGGGAHILSWKINFSLYLWMIYIFKLQILRAFYIILSFFIWTIFEIFTSHLSKCQNEKILARVKKTKLITTHHRWYLWFITKKCIGALVCLLVCLSVCPLSSCSSRCTMVVRGGCGIFRKLCLKNPFFM